MIEVEKKFILTDGESAALTKDAEFLGEKIFTDTYYDTTDYVLTTKDKWLRERDGRWELKLPLNADGKRLADQYDEIEDEAEIRNALGLSMEGAVRDALVTAAYSPFCVCKTTRKKYRKDEFVIDLDAVEFGDFSYGIGEIELIVNEKSEMSGAVAKIMEFAKAYHLTIAPVRGKVIEYLKRKRPEHYEKLVASGVVHDKF